MIPATPPRYRPAPPTLPRVKGPPIPTMQPRHEPELVTEAFLAGVKAGRGRSPGANPFPHRHAELLSAWRDGFAVGTRIEESLAAASGRLASRPA